MSELVLPRPGLRIDGERELVRLIGAGSFGTVYEARQLDLDRVEAIKFLHERWMDEAHRDVRVRFLEEARVMARMKGPHMVEVYDYGSLPGGLPYFVMERLEGQTLRARLLDQGSLPLAEALHVVQEVLLGLCEVHAHGVVHRDVKPENVFLAGGGVKLLDFGLAKTSVALTASDVVMGTPLYMAPELVTGDGQPDARTDVYAAAAVMYELLTGTAPFRRPGISRRELAHAVVHARPAAPSMYREGLAPELDALVLDGLAKRPAERPGTARAMLERLREIETRCVEEGDVEPASTAPSAESSEATVQPYRPGLWPEHGARVPARRQRWAALVGTVAGVVSLLVGGTWLGWSPLPELGRLAGGVLVARASGASAAVEETHGALREALGGDTARPLDTVPGGGVSPLRGESPSAEYVARSSESVAVLICWYDDRNQLTCEGPGTAGNWAYGFYPSPGYQFPSYPSDTRVTWFNCLKPVWNATSTIKVQYWSDTGYSGEIVQPCGY